MQGRMYSVPIDIDNLTTQIDFATIVAPSTGIVFLHKAIVTQISEAGDAESEQLEILIHRTAAVGSGGSTQTPAPHDPSDSAFAGTVRVGDTTQATPATELHREGWNVMAGFFWPPTPEERYLVRASEIICIALVKTPADAISFRVEVVFEALG